MRNLYVARNWKINPLSLEGEAKLQTNVVAASKLRVAESPRGIRCSRNIVRLEIDDPVVIAIVVCRNVSPLHLTRLNSVRRGATCGKREDEKER